MENDVVRRAYLKVTGSKGLVGSLSRFGTRKSWVVLRQESRLSRARVEVFKEEDDFAKRQPTKIIGVDQISTISTAPEKKEIILTVGSEQLTFTCSSKADVDDWIRDIDSLRKNGRAFSKRSSGDDGAANVQFPDDEFFRVRLRQSSSLLFHGPCILEVQRDFERNLFHLALFSEDDTRRSIVKWQIDHIRQYGSNDVAFKFQSGSKSPTGVDWFILETEHGFAPRIHRAVDYWARHIVEQANNIPSSRPAPPPTVPPLRPRSKPDSSSSPIPSPTVQSSTYEPLRPSPQQPALYEDLNKIPVPNRPQSFASTSSSFPGSNGSNGTYQPIIMNPSQIQSPYADLADVTRERSISVSASATTQSSEEYMRLNEATRNPQDALYMGISPNSRK